MNILIKLTCLVGLVIAPILGGGHGHSEDHGKVVLTEQTVVKGQLAQVLGSAYEGEVETRVKLEQKNSEAQLSIDFRSADFSGHFKSKRVIIDGDNYEAQGYVEVLSGDQFLANVKFVSTSEAFEDFVIFIE